MIKKITLFTVIFIFSLTHAFAQDVTDKENLVKNAELEAYTGKLKKLGKFYMVEDWNAYTLERPDLYEEGNENPEIGIPANIYGYQDAHSGRHYAGINAFSYDPKNYRSYLYTELEEPLEKGKMYCVKYYVSLADNSKFAIANLGAFFTKKEMEDDQDVKQNAYETAQVKNNLQKPLKNTRSWEVVCNVYTAAGKERYMIIGNFDPDNETVYEKIMPPPGLKEPQVQMAYYYIDDVSVVPIDNYSQCNCNPKKDRGPDIVYSKSVTISEDMSPSDLVSSSTIYFGFLKKDLNSSAEVDLDRLAQLMNENPSYRLKVNGFTDKEEADEAKEDPNFDNLSRSRAYVAVDYLASKGVDKSRIEVFGLSDTNPASSGNTPLSKAKNRRVEFILLK
jgi:outer membrane protein OmpA-like peptidoglycan-associated protein